MLTRVLQNVLITVFIEHMFQDSVYIHGDNDTAIPSNSCIFKIQNWIFRRLIIWKRIRHENFMTLPWWRHQMETFSALLALCAGNSPVPANSPHKGQWRGALMFSLISARINDWVNNREAGDLRRHRGHYDVSVMCKLSHCNSLEDIRTDLQISYGDLA